MVDALKFLGAGSASSDTLLPSAAVLERARQPLLLIDCGPGMVNAYRASYDALPSAVFITHLHMDHVAGLEALFYASRTLGADQQPRLYVPVTLVAALHARLAEFPNLLAEGGANFWDRLRLIPVSDNFWLGDLRFEVFPVRHHAPYAAYGLALRGRFVYTGDTRPIPEMLTRLASADETVFHDCAPQANPSHTGLEDLRREYSDSILQRLVLYHYPDQATAERYQQAGFRIARGGERIRLGADNGD